MEQRTKKFIWKTLSEHAKLLQLQSHHEHFLGQSNHQKVFQASSFNIELDYSNQHISAQALELLFELATACRLKDKIHALIHGENVNISENKPALHTALRASDDKPIFINQKNILSDILAARHQIKQITEKIRKKQWLGYSGQPITDIVNIGIGGSDLGPRFSLTALKDYVEPSLSYHFISDADPSGFKHTIEPLNRETTLFIISSKSFNTKETLYNALKAMEWMGSKSNQENHFIAVTANIEKARQFGFTTILPIWDWIGGRYSLCSAINLITAIAIGYDQFSQILVGANSMDKHFYQHEFSTNLPVLLGLLGVWNNNFLKIHNLLIWTYSQLLGQFVPYIQQLEMESNGKSIDNNGNLVSHATAPIIWGGLGNRAQHSYFQLICQGTHKITADIIKLKALDGHLINDICSAQLKALTHQSKIANQASDQIFCKIPLNHICIKNYSPFAIGELTALYEHKVFVQSVIWDINPFDQPGVEIAKRNYHEQLID